MNIPLEYSLGVHLYTAARGGANIPEGYLPRPQPERYSLCVALPLAARNSRSNLDEAALGYRRFLRAGISGGGI